MYYLIKRVSIFNQIRIIDIPTDSPFYIFVLFAPSFVIITVLSAVCFFPRDLINVFPFDSNSLYNISSLNPVKRTYSRSPTEATTELILDTADYTGGTTITAD